MENGILFLMYPEGRGMDARSVASEQEAQQMARQFVAENYPGLFTQENRTMKGWWLERLSHLKWEGPNFALLLAVYCSAKSLQIAPNKALQPYLVFSTASVNSLVFFNYSDKDTVMEMMCGEEQVPFIGQENEFGGLTIMFQPADESTPVDIYAFAVKLPKSVLKNAQSL